MSKIKRLAGETVLYGFGSIIPRFLNFLLVWLHTAVFEPEAYGLITKLFAYVAVINTVFMFGMETAYFRFAGKQDEQRIFNITHTVVTLISAGLSIFFIVLCNPIAAFLEIPSRPDLVIYMVVMMFIDAFVAIPFARLRHQKKPKLFVAGKVFNVGILIGLNIYFLKFYAGPLDVSFVVLANLIANAFFIVFFARMLLQWRPMFDRELTPQVFRYAYPVMLTGLAGITNEVFSRITLENWLPANFYPGKSTAYALGVFGACYKLSVLMNLATQSFRYAAEPFFFSNASEKNSPQLFARVNYYFVIAGCMIVLVVSLNLDVLKYFLAQPEYWEGIHIVPVLLLAYLFLGIYYNFSAWFKLTDRTHYGTLITAGGALVTILANYILIPIAGYEGSSWAALLCYLSMMVACYWLGQKFYPIPYNVVKSGLYIIVTLMIVYAVNMLSFSNQIAATSFHLAVVILYIVIVYFLERKNLIASQA